MSHPLSLRVDEATLSRLRSRAAHEQLPPRTLAQRYLEEGLRMDEHPLICFVDGPAGRRARISGTGVDVWELVASIRDHDGDLPATAEHHGLALGLVQAAVGYYGAHRDEIDGWIERNERATAEAHATWQAGRAALAR